MEILKFTFIHVLRVSLFAGLLLSWSGCRKDATVKIPATPPKPVVVGFLSPQDSLITIKVTNSVPLYREESSGNTFEIRDAIVEISNGSSSIRLPYLQDSIGYQVSASQFPIQQGSDYRLKVILPDGRLITSQTKVPNRSITDFELRTEKNLKDSSQFGVQHDLVFNYSWTDPQEEENYYRLLVYSMEFDSIYNPDTTAVIFIDEFMVDGSSNGKKMTATYSLPVFSESVIGMKEKDYLVFLIQCNKDYYLYHKDLANFDDLNPFSERRINFSNISAGIGCFGAYYSLLKRIRK